MLVRRKWKAERNTSQVAMNGRLQFVKWLAALSFCAALAVPSLAEQHPRANWQQNRPPKQAAEKQQRQQARQQQRQEKQAQREAQKNANRPPKANSDSRANNSSHSPSGESSVNNSNRPPNTVQGRSDNPNRPPNRTATPQERQRNEQQFSRLAPQQKQEMRERAQVWQRLSPEQRDHINNDIAPKWRQLPPDRQRAIRSRLNVLKNMPESARNQHLNDPNFTRGMSEEDKAMLRDLGHMHVGGAPEAPPNEQ